MASSMSMAGVQGRPSSRAVTGTGSGAPVPNGRPSSSWGRSRSRDATCVTETPSTPAMKALWISGRSWTVLPRCLAIAWCAWASIPACAPAKTGRGCLVSRRCCR